MISTRKARKIRTGVTLAQEIIDEVLNDDPNVTGRRARHMIMEAAFLKGIAHEAYTRTRVNVMQRCLDED